ncbi:uncharacterized protein EAE98_006082 [Botrytis deweyae]|uniref:Uncharacterized protein n=1 Tax=Botrytis deweyae TaxID=2478750 RepID=A0ABQ7ILL8_9HELO|nr:uncharacterized protein EAE98_006082 [Botrytis deweyae]KAF7927700.1 hypothetical protein EAE98_006082 [Botrytis deweyae]
MHAIVKKFKAPPPVLQPRYRTLFNPAKSSPEWPSKTRFQEPSAQSFDRVVPLDRVRTVQGRQAAGDISFKIQAPPTSSHNFSFLGLIEYLHFSIGFEPLDPPIVLTRNG